MSLLRIFAVRLPIVVVAAYLVPLAIVANGKTVVSQEKPVRLVWFPRFSPDGEWLITAHGRWEEREGGEVRVWEVESGKEKYVIPTDRGVRTVAWSPKGAFFAAGDYGGTLHVFEAQTGEPIKKLKFTASVEVLQISPDEKQLITAHGNGSVHVTGWPAKNEVHLWNQIHRGGIWGMRLAPNGTVLATAGKDGYVRLFDMKSFKILHSLQHPSETNGLAFTRDGKTLLTGCADALIRVFDVGSGTELGKLEGHEQGSITDMQFSSDDKRLASAGIDQRVRLWDVSDLQKPILKATLEGHTGFVFGVAISPKDVWLASAGWDDRIQLWDFATEEGRWVWRRRK